MLSKPTHNTYSFIARLGESSLGLLILLTLAFCCPISSNSSKALDSRIYPDSSLSLSLTQPDDINITPTADGQFGTTKAKLAISTSSNSGYRLYINTLDSTNAMLSTNGSQNTQIAALPSATTSTNFPSNTWGYSLTTTLADDATLYNPMPETSTLAYDTDQAAGDHYLSFAANINTALPAGTYANTVQISAIANPQRITNLSELTYMQDMTSSICQDTKAANGANTVTPGNEVEKRLIDVRDGKEYWVSKLADQNCWMVQNLALDLIAGQKLTNINTDLNSKTEWLTPTTTETTVPTVAAVDYNSVRSWNLGEYVLAIPRDYSLFICTSDPANGSTNPLTNNSLRPNQKFDDLVNGSPRCANFPNVQNWQPTFTAQTDGTWQGQSASLVAADATNKTYDAHYLIGNYYQYNTATASTNEAELAENSQPYNAELSIVQNSICPKGWKLPFSGRNISTGYQYNQNGSFYHLMTAYGYKEGVSHNLTTGGFRMLNGVAGSGNSGASYQNLISPHMSFTTSGVIRPDTGSLWDAGYSGAYLSETINATQLNNFYLNYNTGDVYPSNNAAIVKTYGNSIRCLAR